MTTRRLSSRARASGDGSSFAPFQSFAALGAAGVIANGDTIALACDGSVFRESIISTAIAANDLKIVTYGSGPMPIITAADIVPTASWVATAYTNVWLYQLAGNTGGNIAESGYVMGYVFWDTNLATTAPLLTPGTYTYDPTNFRYYMRPTLTLADAVYDVAVRTSCMVDAGAYQGISFEGIEFRQGSRTIFQVLHRQNGWISDCKAAHCGGNASGGYYIGNAFEFSDGAHGWRVTSNEIVDCFDCAITWQVYDDDATVGDGRAWKNTIRRCGFRAIEMSVTLTPVNCVIYKIDIDHNDISDAAGSWRPAGVTSAAICITTESSAATFRDINIRGNLGVDTGWGMWADVRGCTVTRVRWDSNVMRTTVSPSNGRGIHADGNGDFRNNIVDGFVHGAALFGSAVGAYAVTMNGNTFLGGTYGLLADTTGGTMTLTARNNLWMQSGAFLRTFFATGLTLDIDYCAVKAGTALGGASIGSNSIRPTTAEAALGADYRPRIGSTLLRAVPRLAANRRDADGKQRPLLASIGAYDAARLRARL